jgi:hypothetical protein
MHAVTLLVVLSIISLGSPKAAAPHHFAHNRAAAPDRIWTNDDVKTLREEAPISIIGTTQAFEASVNTSTPREATAERRPYVKEEDPEWYAQEIEVRRLEIASAEAQLAQIAETEKTGQGVSDVVPLDTEPVGVMLAGTIWVLEHQVLEARNEIKALQDLGRQNGIVVAAWR